MTSARETAGSGISPAEVVWLAMAVLVPLAFDPASRSPFGPVKLAIVQVLTSLLLIVVLVETRIRSRHRPRPTVAVSRLSPYGVPAAALLLLGLVSTLRSVSPSTSLLGSYERSQGLISLVSLLLITGIVAASLPGAIGVVRLFRTLAVTAVLVFLVGVAQLAGLASWLGLTGLVSDSPSPMLSTFGRSNFLAAFLAMTLPPVMSLMLVETSGRWRALAALAMMCQASGVAMTGAKSATVAAMVGLSGFCLLTRSGWRRWLRRRWFRLSGAALSAVLLAAGLWSTQVGPSGVARLATWEATLRLIVQRPFFGYGFDGLGLVFPSVFPPELVYYQGRDVWVDRAHNVVLDCLASVGVLGSVALVVLLATALVPAIRELELPTTDPRDRLEIGSLMGLAAAAVDGLASFFVLATATTAALLLACLINLHSSDVEPVTDVGGVDRRVARGRVISWPWVTLLLGLLVCSASAVSSILRWGADRSLRAAEVAAETGSWSVARSQLERSLGRWSLEPAMLSAASRVERQIGLADGEPAQAFSVAKTLLERAVELQPTEFRWHWELASVALGSGLQAFDGHNEGYLRAEEELERALDLAPNHGVLWAEWARLSLLQGQRDLAADRFREAVDLDATDLESWLALAELELERSRLEEARQALERASALRPADPRTGRLRAALDEQSKPDGE